MQRSPFGLVLITLGLVLVVVGVLAWLGALSWFGRLPGDIRVERPGFRFYAPIVSMLIVSLVLTALTALLRRFWP
jgi:TctA family transporter